MRRNIFFIVGSALLALTACQEVTPAPGPPTAVITSSHASGEHTPPVEVTFSGSNSTTASGSITAFEWLIDGAARSGESVTHTFEQAGIYSVRLTVTNQAGRTATTTDTFQVIESSAAFEHTSLELPHENLDGAALTVTASEAWTLASSQAWLTPSPDSGTSGDTVVTLSVDATNLGGDAAQAILTIRVAGETQATLPITMLLPDLAGPFSDTIDLAATTTETATSNFSIQNSGRADLVVSASSSDAWLSVTPQDATISPDSDTLFEVSASCGTDVETRTGAVTLASNDPDEASSSVTVTLDCQDPPPTAFSIDMQYYGSTLPTPEQQQVFTEAAARWSEVITGDLADFEIAKPENECGYGDPDYYGTIDDLLLFANVEPIDGPGGILGSAGPCRVRDNGLPFIGTMTIDSADWEVMNANGTLREVILHEMGHTLGIGSLWEYDADLVDPTGSDCAWNDTSTDYRFNGEEANSYHVAAGGTGMIKVENNGVQGTACGHWHEDTYYNELMTGYLDADTRLSSITIGSLTDLGYTTSHILADPYEVPFGGAFRSSGLGEPLREELRRPIRP